MNKIIDECKRRVKEDGYPRVVYEKLDKTFGIWLLSELEELKIPSIMYLYYIYQEPGDVKIQMLNTKILTS